MIASCFHNGRSIWLSIGLCLIGCLNAASTVCGQSTTDDREKILGHWGEDAIGFRWTEQDSVDGRWQQTEIGPFLGTSIAIDGRPIAKGRVIAIGDQGDAVCYDTQTGLLEGWWRGESMVAFSPARYGLIEHPRISGELLWARHHSPESRQPEYQHRTMLQHERSVLIQGWINQVLVSEHPTVLQLVDSGQTALRRVIRIEPHAEPLAWNSCLPVENLAEVQVIDGCLVARWESGSRAGWLMVRSRYLSDSPQSVDLRPWLESADGGVLSLPSSSFPLEMDCVIIRSEDGEVEPWRAAFSDGDVVSWTELGEPGASLWTESPVTHGRMGESRSGIRMDTVELPFENPYRALMFLSGIDFIDPTTAMISTVHGDVWRVSGLDHNLEQVVWKRYATGLFQPLGLKVLDGKVYVLGRDQLTMLVDRNADGEADEYRCINNQAPTSLGTHDYAACLEIDGEGRFISVRGNTGVERIAADGSTYEVIATGLRNPNGLGVSPDGMTTVAPQEGEWTPASNIAVVQDGNHFGYQGPRVTPERPLGYDPPMIWLPRLLDNSCGGQAWLPDDGWDGMNGGMIHLSFGRCWPLLVLPEQVAGEWQAAALRLPFECESGICRARVQPSSRMLYLAGLKGWASSSVMDGCLHRLVRTEEPLLLPVGVQTVSNGLVIRFDTELDQATVQDRGRWSASHWNYRYSAEYGSADYRPSNPAQPGHDELPIRSVTLRPDKRSVFVEIPSLIPVMQLALSYDLQSASGRRMKETVYQTIHALPSDIEVPGAHAADLDVELAVEQTAPGLVLKFSQAAISGELVNDYRVARRIALSKGFESLSPWIEARGVEATFEGWWFASQRETVLLVVEGNGLIEIQLGSQTLEKVSQTESRIEFAPVVLEKGLNDLRVSWSALEESPERFELLAASEGGFLAPIPAERLRHLADDSRLRLSTERREARRDFAIHQCHRCHALPQDVLLSSERMPELDFEAPKLGSISGSRNPDWLLRWILDPRSLDPRSQMPRLLDAGIESDRQLAADVVAFLVGQGATVPPGESGLPDEAQGAIDWIEEGRGLVEQIGCVACHVAELRENESRRDWSRVSDRFTGSGLDAYLRDPAAGHVLTQMPAFDLSDEERRAIGAYLLSLGEKRDNRLEQQERREVVGDAERGRMAFESLGCAACHSLSSDSLVAWGSRELEELDSGCLASDRSSEPASAVRVPDFGWEESRLARMRAFLEQDTLTFSRESRHEVSERWTSWLQCTACHNRDGALGDLATILFEESEQGLSPEWLPDLSWVDEKLEHEWAEAFLAGDDRQPLRPWLRARMPAFPGYAHGLAEGWRPELDQAQQERERWYEVDEEVVQAGARLIAPTAFDCRQCHALGALPATGDQRSQIALGIDFVQAGKRLRPRYFHQWMSDPLAVDPMTKMPVYSEDGLTTKIATEFDGQASEQFRAILQYLRSVAREESSTVSSPE